MTDQPASVDVGRAEALRAALDELVPGALADGELDAAQLRDVLGLPAADERYGLAWSGKQEAVRSVRSSNGGALVPDAAASVAFETADDVFIEGDNLDVLRLLQEEYAEQVKVIAIDPPYNTGSGFVFHDDFADGPRQPGAASARPGSEDERHAANAELADRRHSGWLSMIYPRLVLARSLLRRDGVIVIHIDEHEVHRLALLLEEVFGPENNLGDVIWDKRNPKGDAGAVSTQHESILVFAKDRQAFLADGGIRRTKPAAQQMLDMARRIWSTVGTHDLPADLVDALGRHGVPADALRGHEIEVTPELARKQYARWLRSQPFTGGELAYKKIDDDGEVYRLVSMAWPNKQVPPDDYWIPLIHPVTGKACPVPARGWRNPPATMQKLLDAGRIVFGPDERTQPQRKYLLRENMSVALASVFPYGGSDDRLLAELGIPFDTPKPIELIADLLGGVCRGDDLVLDFFAGSGSTAHAVALQNERDGGTRRMISVNIPEATMPGSMADRAGFATVSEITLARLRWIATESGLPSTGLRVYRLEG